MMNKTYFILKLNKKAVDEIVFFIEKEEVYDRN